MTIRGSASLPLGCDNVGFEDFDSTPVYLKGTLGSPEGVRVIGNPTWGPDAGDRILVAGADEYLCFQVELPLGTGNTYQGLITTAHFTSSLNSQLPAFDVRQSARLIRCFQFGRAKPNLPKGQEGQESPKVPSYGLERQRPVYNR